MATFDPKEVFVVLGFDKLREVVGDLDQNFLAFVIGDLTIGDGEGGLYHWIEDRTTADDGAETIVPPTQLPARRGCWRRMFGYGAMEGARSVNSIAELRSLDGNDSSLKTVVMTGYATQGDGGGGVFVWDDDTTTADNIGTVVVTSTSPRVGCWKRLERDSWSVRWFGAVGDNVTDDAAAFQAAIDASYSGSDYGRSVYVPPGDYRIGSTLEFNGTVRMRGDFGLFLGATRLHFDAGVTGIHLPKSSPPLYAEPAGSFSEISNLVLIGGGGATAHGIFCERTPCIRNVRVETFSGSGIYMYGYFTLEGSNCNTFMLDNVWCVQNGLHGVHALGDDVNAGLGLLVSCTDNGGYGIRDEGFLGNAWIGCHSDSNDLGAYYCDEANGRSVFVGCYSEGGQPASVFGGPMTIVGGLHGAGLGDANAIVGENVNTPIEIRCSERSDQPGTGRDAVRVGGTDALVSFTPEGNETAGLMRLKYKTTNPWAGCYLVNMANLDSDISLVIPTDASLWRAGDLIAAQGLILEGGSFLGSAQDRTYLTQNAANTAKDRDTEEGAILFNQAGVSETGVAAWIGLGTGTPAQFNPIYCDRRVIHTYNGIVNSKVTSEATTSRTLADTDDNVTILCTSAGATTITVPSTLTKGTIVRLVQAAAGQITVVGSGGVVIRVPTGRTATSRALYSCVEVEMIGSLDAEVRGDLTGIGDVLGPASSTDNAIVRFDSTTGKLVQNSGVLVDDSANLVLPKTSGVGVKVDVASPTFAWADIIGNLDPKTSGAGTPTLNAFRGGNVNVFSFAANDLADMQFHIPHDYLPGSDIYIHVHWAHNGTAISGSFVCDFFHTYQKGHNQGDFPAEKTLTLTVSTPDIATIPQYRHRVDEVQLSASSPSAAQIDSDDLEPDGVILMRMRTTTIPTITGSAARNEPYIFFVDIHYQTTGVIGTKAKSPGFWT